MKIFFISKHVQLFFSSSKATGFSETFRAHGSVATINLEYNRAVFMSQFYKHLQRHLQVGGVDEGGVPAGEEGDGGRHLADVSDPVGDVELSPDRLPLLSTPGTSSLNALLNGWREG